MNDNKNLILAVVLSALILLGWSFLSNKFIPQNPPPKVENGKVEPQVQPQKGPVANAPSQLRDRNLVLRETPRVLIETPALRGSINLKGARIDDLWMLKHHVTYKQSSSPVALLNPQGTAASSFVGFSWNGPNAPNGNTVWTASSQVLTPGKPVTLSWTSPAGQTYQLVISVDDLYLFTVEQRVTNGSTQPVDVQPYSYSSRAGRSADISSYTVHVGPMSVRDGKADYETKWQTVREAGPNGLNYDPSKGWIGFTDKYWLTALAPQGTTRDSFRYSASGAYQADAVAPQSVVAPGQTASFTTSVFAGAKEKAALDRYENAGITKLSKSIDWGWFELVHASDLRSAELAVPPDRQLRRRHHLSDADRARAHVPDRPEAVPVDGRDAQAAAENESDPGALQGRQAQASAGDDEAVPAGEDQSCRRLPADRASDPDLLRALQGADGRRRNAAPALRPVDQGPFGAGPADPDQPVRPAGLRASALPRDRRAADPARA